MGDPRRFALMADLVNAEFPEHRHNEIADVAGGKGGLKAALHRLGWYGVTVVDVRHRLAKGRPGQHYGKFTWREPRRWSLVLGMHPDEATDNIVLYAARTSRPFVVCPCCIKPDAAPYTGRQGSKADWLAHIEQLASHTHNVSRCVLPMMGDAVVLIGRRRSS